MKMKNVIPTGIISAGLSIVLTKEEKATIFKDVRKRLVKVNYGGPRAIFEDYFPEDLLEKIRQAHPRFPHYAYVLEKDEVVGIGIRHKCSRCGTFNGHHGPFCHCGRVRWDVETMHQNGTGEPTVCQKRAADVGLSECPVCQLPAAVE
jgi:hypothetical protein